MTVALQRSSCRSPTPSPSTSHDGDTVALEGFTHLIPFAAGHEIIRQGRRDLTLVRMTPDVIYDQMIGMGCARKLVFSYGGNPGVGSLHRMRDAVENGWPRAARARRALARGHGQRLRRGRRRGCRSPSLRGYAGTDLVEHDGAVAFVECPFTGERLSAVRAVNPDVAVIHAQQADRAGQRACSGACRACRRRPCSPPSARS